MSGGVDSSVAAALLVEQGYEVIGVTMCLLRSYRERSVGACCSIESMEDAKRVAAKLDIRHVVLPMQDAFEEYVIEDFIEEYRRGHTPNPCVRCNKYLKFDVLLDWARSVGAERIATGHYARIRYDEERSRWLLLRGGDKSKDQSYALYSLTQPQLERTLFPLGELTKFETRRKAEELGLVVAKKPDSQEICFVADGRYPEFLVNVAPELAKPGPIVDVSGRLLGQHSGIAFYTIGQRKRLGISSTEPKYVVRIDYETNTVVVGGREDLYSTRLIAKDMNWIAFEMLPGSLAATAKIRYNTNDSDAAVRPIGDDMAEVIFERPQRAITPGQAVVLYQGDTVLGGGTIADPFEAETAREQVLGDRSWVMGHGKCKMQSAKCPDGIRFAIAHPKNSAICNGCWDYKSLCSPTSAIANRGRSSIRD
ncbi:MAG: tRNA 2-thiouridine(34) synthase MnmA [Armatimonadetes bacterium]|nr:tRNA 2-thiouridine(34) synthase MnmA [Armatimonadota bacterium]